MYSSIQFGVVAVAPLYLIRKRYCHDAIKDNIQNTPTNTTYAISNSAIILYEKNDKPNRHANIIRNKLTMDVEQIY